MLPKVFCFSDLLLKGELYTKLSRSIENGRLVPVLGCGFSVDLLTKHGKIPSVNEFSQELIKQLKNALDYEGVSEDELKSMALSDVADAFLNVLPNLDDGQGKQASQPFLQYMEENFSAICKIPQSKKRFLKCGWSYIYTLNYDNAIETVLPGYEIVAPYIPLNTAWLRNKSCIIKLHGDVHMLLKTSDMRYCILSKKQYLDSITDKKNGYLMRWLQDDFSSKDMLFLGCGLNNEYDFLFADGGKQVGSLQGDAKNNSFYVFYDKNPDQKVPIQDMLRLQNYGIENIIRVKPDEYLQFYDLLADMQESSQMLKKADKLEAYREFAISRLEPSQMEENISYIFENGSLGINSRKKELCLPYFFIRRTVTESILKDIYSNVPICVLAGNRFSGKTYALLDLLRELQTKRVLVYYINGINVDDSVLDYILQKKNAVFLFDSGAISNQQYYQKIVRNIATLKENRVRIVYVVNRSDRNYVKVFQRIEEEYNNDIKTHFIDTRFDAQELNAFNENMSVLTLISRKGKETFLDYAIRIEQVAVKDYPNVFLDPDILRTDTPHLLRCVLLLANNGSLSNDLANCFDVRDELTDLCKSAERAVQKDYLTEVEVSPGIHSGVKFVVNSSYWLYRCLSNFAKNTSHYEAIAESVFSIVQQYLRLYTNVLGEVNKDVYEQIRPYYYLDNLQQMFFFDAQSKGSLTLPDCIYGRLKNILNEQYQFLHQTAKCKFRYSQQLRNDPEKSLTNLNEANLIIHRAYELALQSKSRNKMYTLTHMNVTKALILTNYLRHMAVPEEKKAANIKNAIENYYYCFVAHREYAAELNSDEASDVKWFVEQFVVYPYSFRRFVVDYDHRNKVNEIVTAYYAKDCHIAWD